MLVVGHWWSCMPVSVVVVVVAVSTGSIGDVLPMLSV
jgi:hypothetical protein